MTTKLMAAGVLALTVLLSSGCTAMASMVVNSMIVTFKSASPAVVTQGNQLIAAAQTNEWNGPGATNTPAK